MPSTAQFGDGARVLVASTPYGTEGLFAKLYQQASSGELADAIAQHASTAEANPAIPRSLLESEQARDPDGFRQEYEAQFTGSGDSYLDFERIELAARGPLEPDACTGWIAGLDPAFARDPMGLAIVGRHPHDRHLLRLGYAESRRATGGFTGPLDEVATICKRYGARVVTDQHAAVPVVERLRRAGLTVSVHNVSASSKTAAFGELRARLYSQELEIYEHPALIAELTRLRTRYAAGSAAVVNPRIGGSHGDVASALSLAIYELRAARGQQRRLRVGVAETDRHGQRTGRWETQKGAFTWTP